MSLCKFRTVLVEFSQLFFYRILERKLYLCKTVLDVGCGNISPLKNIKKVFWSEGIDIFKPYIIESKKKRIHNSYKVADIRKLDKLYRPKSFDAVVALDVIEHLNKREGKKLLFAMEKIAKKMVILLTPNGVNEQNSYDDNPYQIHKSGWNRDELEKLGYKVYGLRGLKCLRNQYAGIKYKPYFFWGFLSFISEIIFYPFPSLSFDLFAVKNIRMIR